MMEVDHGKEGYFYLCFVRLGHPKKSEPQYTLYPRGLAEWARLTYKVRPGNSLVLSIPDGKRIGKSGRKAKRHFIAV